MFWGAILLASGIFILLSVVLSITSPVWLVIGSVAIVAGVISMIKSFPTGIGLAILGLFITLQSLGFLKLGFWELIASILASGLIEIGLKILISSKANRNVWRD
ncbi:MAG: hypothetical protein ACK4R7_00215 [Fervidobacterium sp.]